VREILQSNNVNCAIVKDNVRWMSGKELMFIRDVMHKNKKFVTTQWNNHISPSFGVFHPQFSRLSEFIQIGHDKRIRGLNLGGLCE